MSKRVARKVTAQPLHTPKDGELMIVRALQGGDLGVVATRVEQRLVSDAQRNPLVNPHFDSAVFTAALAHATDHTWVARERGLIVGHLFGALLESAEYGWSAWVGPDGVSFDDETALFALYRTANASWVRDGAREHFVWVFDAETDTRPWRELNFYPAHRRGIMSLATVANHELPPGYVLRRGGVGDLELALTLDRVIDAAESFKGANDANVSEAQWRELLDDDEVTHYVVEYSGRGVAQCVTYPLAPRRGSFDDTVHVSAVAVLDEHQHRGVAQALVTTALLDARTSGAHYAETNWRVTNEPADAFWTEYGFLPTYVQLRRTSEND